MIWVIRHRSVRHKLEQDVRYGWVASCRPATIFAILRAILLYTNYMYYYYLVCRTSSPEAGPELRVKAGRINTWSSPSSLVSTDLTVICMAPQWDCRQTLGFVLTKEPGDDQVIYFLAFQVHTVLAQSALASRRQDEDMQQSRWRVKRPTGAIEGGISTVEFPLRALVGP